MYILEDIINVLATIIFFFSYLRKKQAHQWDERTHKVYRNWFFYYLVYTINHASRHYVETINIALLLSLYYTAIFLLVYNSRNMYKLHKAQHLAQKTITQLYKELTPLLKKDEVLLNTETSRPPPNNTLQSTANIGLFLMIFSITEEKSMSEVDPIIFKTSLLTVLVLLLISTYWMLRSYLLSYKTSDIFFFSNNVIMVFNTTLALFIDIRESYLASGLLIVISTIMLSTAITLSLEQKLEEIIFQLKNKTELLREQVEKNYQLSEQLAAAAEELSANVEEITATGESILSTETAVSENANKQLNAIITIQKRFNEFLKNISAIREFLNNIEQIGDFIKELSEQTDLLALNAAIEAARAREAGRGFQVVAEQIRQLAQKTKEGILQTDKTLKEIRNLIEREQSESNEIVSLVEEIAKIADKSSLDMEAVTVAIREESDAMSNISVLANNLAKMAADITDYIKDYLSQ